MREKLVTKPQKMQVTQKLSWEEKVRRIFLIIITFFSCRYSQIPFQGQISMKHFFF